MSEMRRLYEPRPVAVRLDARGSPRAVGGVAVQAVREDWVVEDLWWTDHPLHRRYFELSLVDGSSVTVFRDVLAGRWYRQAV